jgi:hypothetical protein
MAECVGCGYCCLKSPCEACRRIYPGATLCPALYWNKEKKMHRCKLMELPGDVGLAYRNELYAGTECSSSLFNDWRIDIRCRLETIEKGNKNPLSSDLQAFAKALASEPFISSDTLKIAVYGFINELQKKGYEKKESEYLGSWLQHVLFENRNSFAKDFMG